MNNSSVFDMTQNVVCSSLTKECDTKNDDLFVTNKFYILYFYFSHTVEIRIYNDNQNWPYASNFETESKVSLNCHFFQALIGNIITDIAPLTETKY